MPDKVPTQIPEGFGRALDRVPRWEGAFRLVKVAQRVGTRSIIHLSYSAALKDLKLQFFLTDVGAARLRCQHP